MTLYEDRRRAESFGEDAARYDRTRPTYPPALVDALLDGRSGLDVVDVGCGTGKAGLLFAARGCTVLGVEPDARMAAIASGHGLEVEVATFEEWDPADRTFDLVVSGQAWHWVDPAAGLPKTHEVLRPGGALAVFWNRPQHDPAVAPALDEIYARVAPDLVTVSLALGKYRRTFDREGIIASGLFDEPRLRTFEWDALYTRDEWLDQLPTHSDHRALAPEVLAALLDAVGALIDEHGGSIAVHYETTLTSARRR